MFLKETEFVVEGKSLANAKMKYHGVYTSMCS